MNLKNRKIPKISVIMPAYNAEKYIARAIKSIIYQSFSDLELIIIDDKSSDKTVVITQRFMLKDKRIRLIKNKKNIKIAASLNVGIRHARAGLIARLDADDISHPDRLRLQYHFMEQNPKVAVVGANMIIINSTGQMIGTRIYPQDSEKMKKVMFRYSPFAHPVVMYRSKVVKEFGCYNTNLLCEDTDLWFKIGAKYELGNLPQFLLKYTLVQSSNTLAHLRQIELDGLKVKINAILKLGYVPSLYDVLYNIAEYSTLWIMPAGFRIWFYTHLRGKGLI